MIPPSDHAEKQRGVNKLRDCTLFLPGGDDDGVDECEMQKRGNKEVGEKVNESATSTLA